MADIVCACQAHLFEWLPTGKLKKWKGKPLLIKLKRAGYELPDLPKNRREAILLGWEEGEYGWECVSCVAKRKAQEALDDIEEAEDGAINKMLAEAGLLKEI